MVSRFFQQTPYADTLRLPAYSRFLSVLRLCFIALICSGEKFAHIWVTSRADKSNNSWSDNPKSKLSACKTGPGDKIFCESILNKNSFLDFDSWRFYNVEQNYPIFWQSEWRHHDVIHEPNQRAEANICTMFPKLKHTWIVPDMRLIKCTPERNDGLSHLLGIRLYFNLGPWWIYVRHDNNVRLWLHFSK